METVRSLVHQVARATPKTGNERDVVTYISRPMWRQWLTELGDDPDTEPTNWYPDASCHRVYGSLTIVLERDDFVSWSRAMDRPEDFLE